MSRAILDELLSVLARKFARDREELARVTLFVSGFAEIAEAREEITIFSQRPLSRVMLQRSLGLGTE